MDPKAQFEARYKSYIEKRNLTLNQAHVRQAEDIVQGSGGGHKIKFGYALFALLAIAVPATVLLLGQQQDIRQRASGPETAVPQGAIKQVGTSYITTSDVDLRIQQLYGTNSAKFKNDLAVRQKILDQLIREKVIQFEAAKQNITVTDKEIDDKAREIGFIPPFDRTQLFNIVLEDKLKTKVISWRLIDYLFVFKESTLPTNASDIARVNKSYESVKAELAKGKTMKEAFNTAKTTSGFDRFIALNENRKVYKKDMDGVISDAIFTYKKGQTTNIIDSKGGTYILAKILDSNDTGFTSFDDWLQSTIKTDTK